MKQFFTILIVIFQFSSQSANYYVSNSGKNTNSGRGEIMAWKTISKINSMFSRFNPGDSILFKRGESFNGSLIFEKSGTAAHNIVIGAYGTGAKPLFDGLTTLTSWTDLGGGIWQTNLPDRKTTLNMVTLNGKPKALGRIPNNGYLTVDSFNSNVSITDAALKTSPGFEGAELVMRNNAFVISRNIITNHTNHTITYSATSTYNPKAGCSYFIQNSPITLDILGEWYFKGATKSLLMFFGTNTPSDFKIQASVNDTLLKMGASSYITITNIAFRGANEAAIYGQYGRHNTIKNCDFNFSGQDAIFLEGERYCTIENCNIYNSLGSGIASIYWSHANECFTIRNNVIKNSNMLPGMSKTTPNAAALWAGRASLIEYNYIDSVGYDGIKFTLDSSIVRNNYVNYFCSVKNDGGGIYTTGSTGEIFENKSYISNNIIRNGIGAAAGSPSATRLVEGIYLDLHSNNVDITGNSISDIGSSGIFLSSTQNINIKSNTIYNCGDYNIQLVRLSNTYRANATISIHGNILCQLNRKAIYYNSAPNDEFSKVGTSDNNYFITQSDTIFQTLIAIPPWIHSYYSLKKRKSVFIKDLNSSYKNISNQLNLIRYEFNETKSDKTILLSKPMTDISGTKFSGTITLQPFTSKILFVTPN